MYVSKRTRLTLLLASCTFFFAAVAHFGWSVARQRGRPVAFCNEPIHDFGVAKSGDRVEHDFVIENRGSEPLFLDNVRTDCRCSGTTLSRRVIPPGDSATLKVRLSLQGIRGDTRSLVLVESNDPRQPKLLLAVQGIADYDLLVEPSRVVFGPTDNDPRTETVQLSSTRKDVFFRVLRAITDWEYLQPKIETIADGSIYHIHVTLLPEGLGVERPSTVPIAVVTDHPAESVIRIPVSLPSSSK